MEEGRIGILKNGKDLSIISDRISTEKGNRFNDVVADPVGRVLCGTMALNSSGNTEPPGTLYSFDLDRKLTPLIKGVTIPNGMGFSLDQKTLYYTETLDYKIYQFDYDLSTGQISNRKTFVYSSEGDEKVVACDTMEEFMNVLEFVRNNTDEDLLSYSDPL